MQNTKYFRSSVHFILSYKKYVLSPDQVSMESTAHVWRDTKVNCCLAKYHHNRWCLLVVQVYIPGWEASYGLEQKMYFILCCVFNGNIKLLTKPDTRHSNFQVDTQHCQKFDVNIPHSDPSSWALVLQYHVVNHLRYVGYSTEMSLLTLIFFLLLCHSLFFFKLTPLFFVL